MGELRWYLEDFLGYPFPPETDRAEHVLKSLKIWGELVFNALFGNRLASQLFDSATSNDYRHLHIWISSDDPKILAWPWEAIRDPQTGPLAHTCQISRQLNKIRDSSTLAMDFPRDRINVLLVIARPYQNDVGFRSIARHLMELIRTEKLPLRVDLLRPPTLDQLRSHLRKHRSFYHILHFDGHGSYSSLNDSGGGISPEGQLVFETDGGQPDVVTSEQLSALLRECAVPAVVLNACQSGMLDNRADDPFASVAASLLQSGMRSVVAMAYALYVSGAQQFLPPFYRSLFEDGSIAHAVRCGRQQMLAHRGRTCARGEFNLNDWVVPVLYEQTPLDFSFAAAAPNPTESTYSKLPLELQRTHDPHRFVGRDGYFMALERALRRTPPAILVQGLGGVGKTTLARGFLHWLNDTGGLCDHCFWFTFQEIYGAGYVINKLGATLLGKTFVSLDETRQTDALAKVLRERKCLIVWDNFESAAGIEGTTATGNLTEVDRLRLKNLLEQMVGGASKVLITSRSPEDWLGLTTRVLLPLEGLQNEESWELCANIVGDLNLRIDFDDRNLADLIELLRGHPLAIRAVLPHVEEFGAAHLVDVVRSNIRDLTDASRDTSSLNAVLKFVEDILPKDFEDLLAPLSFHEAFLDLTNFAAIVQKVRPNVPPDNFRTFAKQLVAAGLLRSLGTSTFEIHPALTGYLRSRHPVDTKSTNEHWANAFVEVMSSFADGLSRLELHKKSALFLNNANLNSALREAERSCNFAHAAVIVQALGNLAYDLRDTALADRLFSKLTELAGKLNHEGLLASSYFRLGNVALLRRNLSVAEAWHIKSFSIRERLGDEIGLSADYYELGKIARERRDLKLAEDHLLRSLRLAEKMNNERNLAAIYHELGMLEHVRLNYPKAKQWFQDSLAIKERLGDERQAAYTHHHLARIESARQNLTGAFLSYHRALEIEERLGDQLAAAGTHLGLGNLAMKRGDLEDAEKQYFLSLALSEKLSHDHLRARAFHQLGILSQRRQAFEAAEQWFRKALEIKERLQDLSDAVTTINQLAALALIRQEHEKAEQLLTRASELNSHFEDEHVVSVTRGIWGSLSLARKQYLDAGKHLVDSVRVFVKANDMSNAVLAGGDFLTAYHAAPENDKQALERLWNKVIPEIPFNVLLQKCR